MNGQYAGGKRLNVEQLGIIIGKVSLYLVIVGGLARKHVQRVFGARAGNVKQVDFVAELLPFPAQFIQPSQQGVFIGPVRRAVTAGGKTEIVVERHILPAVAGERRGYIRNDYHRELQPLGSVHCHNLYTVGGKRCGRGNLVSSRPDFCEKGV